MKLLNQIAVFTLCATGLLASALSQESRIAYISTQRITT